MMASLADLLNYDQRKKQALQALTDYASSQYKLGSAFGEGLSDQAKGLVQMVRHPIDTATQMYQAGKSVVQNPKAAVQAAKEGLTEAVSSPENIARFAGQNFSPADIANALNKMGTMREIAAHHGTASDFGKFDIAKQGSSTGAGSAKSATWFVDKPQVAKGYAVYAAENAPIEAAMKEADKLEKLAQKTGNQKYWDLYDQKLAEVEQLDKQSYERRKELAKVLTVDIPDETNFHVVDAGGKTPNELSKSGDIDSWLQKQLKDAKAAGKAGVKITNLDDTAGGINMPATHYGIFDPSSVKILKSQKVIPDIKQDLTNYADTWRNKGVEIDVYPSKADKINLSKIVVNKEKQNQGLGSQAINDLVEYANDSGKTITLSPSTDFGGTSINRLKEFYKKFGFVENKGKNKDFSISDTMYKLPNK